MKDVGAGVLLSSPARGARPLPGSAGVWGWGYICIRKGQPSM